ncbi:MAG: tRNA preQ1(34) S-adenosylmethionine ribosyltransferase-isomerase QueA [Candidatus Pacebacteria bacterium]|nr:tRNA preQ1(34) S-adenosylmethionine ribosyltransferase-isomerase QueA [Candidatus Paceibacterota bacterium]
MALHLSDFDYHLPQERIAQIPIRPRDQSKLLVVNRKTGTLDHHHFYDLSSLLTDRDVLVLNNSKTLPMRTFGKKMTGGSIEILFLKKIAHDISHETWEVLSRPGIKKGQIVKFFEGERELMSLKCSGDVGYARIVDVYPMNCTVIEALHRIGQLPTPHYIHTLLSNPDDYQTIYAKPEGSAATPTAGLHFTQSLFDKLDKKGVQRIEITLHVGLGTFLPVKVDDITKHTMHKEWFMLTAKQADQLNTYKREGRRIIAVGTTSSRVLESCSVWNEKEQRHMLQSQTGETQAFFYPPYRFKYVDALITNFHLPKSTLLMLLSAFCAQNQPFISFQESMAGKAYTEAIKEGYRFFSFGDAMFIE